MASEYKSLPDDAGAAPATAPRQTWASKPEPKPAGYAPPSSEAPEDERKPAPLPPAPAPAPGPPASLLAQEEADLEFALSLQEASLRPAAQAAPLRSAMQPAVLDLAPAASSKANLDGDAALAACDGAAAGYQMMPLGSPRASGTPEGAQEREDRELALRLHGLEVRRCRAERAAGEQEKREKVRTLQMGRSSMR
ncbi:hypothetical protein TeGR_g9886 [Tetraparma gracilis]|uniref:Uncharacterized protein n=1 Tax=Tetraparma gracilis TaxID=2962635 RepID=A0ABQ6MPI0_9STRA|nr:hypothetical protein TeGR_g9886 [Tetraparma gracilis]